MAVVTTSSDTSTALVRFLGDKCTPIAQQIATAFSAIKSSDTSSEVDGGGLLTTEVAKAAELPVRFSSTTLRRLRNGTLDVACDLDGSLKIEFRLRST